MVINHRERDRLPLTENNKTTMFAARTARIMTTITKTIQIATTTYQHQTRGYYLQREKLCRRPV